MRRVRRSPRPSRSCAAHCTAPEDGAIKKPLIRVSDIPQDGTVTADLMGREVLVTLLNGRPRAYLNACMHHGGPLTLEADTFTCDWHGSKCSSRS
jgi:nitrite reductase/ring-hydroxylating ferredoxin subunit